MGFYADPLPCSLRSPLLSSTSGSAALFIGIPVKWYSSSFCSAGNWNFRLAGWSLVHLHFL